jgi:dolichyl-phosphate beta-glucosyltransferase
MLEATGQLRLFCDADLSTPIYEIDKILDTFKNGTEIFVGSRALDKTMIKEHQPFYREYMGKTFNFIVQSMVFKGIKDTQCGFKAFTAEAAKNIFSKAKIDGFGFDVEVLYIAQKVGYKIQEVPVEWYNDKRSTVNPFSDSWRMFLDALRVRRLHG